jgi:hypothetical protein
VDQWCTDVRVVLGGEADVAVARARGGGIGGCGGAGPKEVARAVGHGADGGAEEKSVGAECGPDTNQ